MAKKKAQPKKSNVTITMNGEVVLAIELDNKLFKSFSGGFMAGLQPFLRQMTQTSPIVADMSDYFKRNPEVPPMTKEEIDELIKKYSEPEVK